MEMISDEKNSSAIVWYPNGQHFEVISKEIFLSDVLPRYMKATKWSSFTRKLSRWGFERIKKGRYTNSFFHKVKTEGHFISFQPNRLFQRKLIPFISIILYCSLDVSKRRYHTL